MPSGSAARALPFDVPTEGPLDTPGVVNMVRGLVDAAASVEGVVTVVVLIILAGVAAIFTRGN